MAKIKYRSGNSFVEIFDTATISNIQTRLSTVETKANSTQRSWNGIWLVEKRSDGVCTAIGNQTLSLNSSGIYEGGLLFYNFTAPNFPSGLFKSAPNVMATIQSANATAWIATNTDQQPSTTKPGNVRIISASSGPLSFTVRFEAIGSW